MAASQAGMVTGAASCALTAAVTPGVLRTEGGVQNVDQRGMLVITAARTVVVAARTDSVSVMVVAVPVSPTGLERSVTVGRSKVDLKALIIKIIFRVCLRDLLRGLVQKI
jgi:hypothetical protein